MQLFFSSVSIIYASQSLIRGAPAFAQSAPKMHLDQGIKALESGDNQGAKMHLNAADQALAGSSSSRSIRKDALKSRN